eukprot:4404034-Pyramimonas_sp.AAC.1
MSLIPFFVPHSGVIYSDCMTVVKLCAADPSHQVGRRHRHAGMRRGALRHDERDHAPEVRHTPAHR